MRVEDLPLTVRHTALYGQQWGERRAGVMRHEARRKQGAGTAGAPAGRETVQGTARDKGGNRRSGRTTMASAAQEGGSHVSAEDVKCFTCAAPSVSVAPIAHNVTLTPEGPPGLLTHRHRTPSTKGITARRLAANTSRHRTCPSASPHATR